MKRWRFTDGPPTLHMTAMIDITFLLLVFFICATRFRMQEGKIDSFLPPEGTQRVTEKPEPPPASLLVRIRRDPGGRVVFRLDGAPCRDVPTLLGRILAAKRFRDIDRVIVHPDADVPHGKVISVLDTCRKAGIPDVAFPAPRAGS
jgi:biopolymer transport protein ExbD